MGTDFHHRLIGICLPLFAASLLIVLLLEWLVLSRITPVRNWLGLITKSPATT
jgi:hypothetical protein